MSNNCKWYMKGRLYERIKDFSHGKWMASVQHTKYSLCVTEHSTENTPIFFWGWKKERGNKPCYWDPSFFDVTREKTVNLSLSKSHRKKGNRFCFNRGDISRTALFCASSQVQIYLLKVLKALFNSSHSRPLAESFQAFPGEQHHLFSATWLSSNYKEKPTSKFEKEIQVGWKVSSPYAWDKF